MIAALCTAGVALSGPLEAAASPAAPTAPQVTPGIPGKTFAPSMVNARFFPALVAAGSVLGDPYRWGGSAPGGFDCSGLVNWSFAHAGVELPRTSGALHASTTRIPEDQILPGDLVFFGSPVHHVGIYVGDGLMVHSPRSGDVVRYAPIHRNGMSATSFGRIS